MNRASLPLAFAAGLLTVGTLAGQTIHYVGNLDFVPVNPAVSHADVRFEFSLPEGPIATVPNRSFGGTSLDVPNESFATPSTLTANGRSALYDLWITPSGQPPLFARSSVEFGISDEFAFYPDHSGPTDNVPEYAFYLSGADITTGPSSPVVFAKPGTFIGINTSQPGTSEALYNALSPFWTSAEGTSYDVSLVDNFKVTGTVIPVPEGPTFGLALMAALSALGLGVYRRIQASIATSHDVS
jgi:hypothetical protein